MADNIQFDLVSPERKLASAEVTEVKIPGAEGDLTAMAGHEPTILTLRPGRLIARGAAGEDVYIVSGGFAEVSAEGVTVLAEMALPTGEMTQEVVTDLLLQARKAHEETVPETHATTEKIVADLVHLAEDMGYHAHV